MSWNSTILIFTLGIIIVTVHSFAADDTRQAVEQFESASAGRSIEAIQATISTLESEQGAYNPALQQALLDMGLLYREQGDYDKAVEAFEKALQVSKANSGLHELSQLNIVELLIDTYSVLHDWQGLDKNLHYLLWLYRRNYNDGDDRLLPVITRVGRWYMQAYQLHSGGEAVSYLVKADDLYDEALRSIISQYGEQATQLVDILNLAATVNYQIANDVGDAFKMSHRDIRQAMIPNKRPSPYMNEIAVRDFYFDQSFHKGKRHLARIISIYESNLPASIQKYAQSIVYQGDYYLSLNRKWNAMKNYGQAYALLVENNVEEDAFDLIFGQPRRVEPFTIPGNELPETSESSYVDAAFNVPANGWPRDIVITATQPENDAELNVRGKYAIAATRFRPRFEKGKPAESKGISLRYIFNK